MNKTVASLKEQAAALGGISLTPKKQKKAVSLAFTFNEKFAAERLLDWTRNAGIQASLRGTYHAVLVTAVVPL